MGRTIILGAATSGLAAAAFLARQGQRVLVTDRQAVPDPETTERVAALGVACCWGGHPLDLLDDCTEVVLSPGVPPAIPFVQEARARGISVVGEVELAHRVLRQRDPEARILAVTGTNGKSTTTDLLAHLLRSAGLPTVACGNLGTPLIEALEGAVPGTRFALECSSYQLESVVDFHAEAAVLLNLTPDHLARHGTMDGYLEAKLRIFRHQVPGDLRLLPAGFPVAEVPGAGQAVVFGWGEPMVPGAWCDPEGSLWWVAVGGVPVRLLHRSELRIPGDHNVDNALAAVALAIHGGAGLEGIREGLRTYPGLAHRIAFCGERDGILAYNDSKGTNVDATLTAIRALPGPLVLMLGGEDKGASYEPLREALGGKLRSLVFLGDAMPMLARDLGDLPHVAHWAFDEACAAAFALAQPGDQILFSPACASFDQFRNFEHRGECFEARVRAWVSAG